MKYRCAVCGNEVRVVGDDVKRTCGHDGATVTVEMRADVAGKGALK